MTRDICVALAERGIERRVAPVVARSHLGAELREECHRLQRANGRSKMERCAPLVVGNVDVGVRCELAHHRHVARRSGRTEGRGVASGEALAVRAPRQRATALQMACDVRMALAHCGIERRIAPVVES
eukprot:scaffold21306_cov58-Phaeocystis_antarctica.AAC.3